MGIQHSVLVMAILSVYFIFGLVIVAHLRRIDNEIDAIIRRLNAGESENLDL